MGILVGAYIWSADLGDAFAAQQPSHRLETTNASDVARFARPGRHHAGARQHEQKLTPRLWRLGSSLGVGAICQKRVELCALGRGERARDVHEVDESGMQSRDAGVEPAKAFEELGESEVGKSRSARQLEHRYFLSGGSPVGVE